MEEVLDVLDERGLFTGKVATRKECHANGYWHRAVYGFIIDQNHNVLLQRRGANKRMWPNKWDVTVGGHVISGEIGRQAIKRECKEELGLKISDAELKYIISSTSVYSKNGYNNMHYDECYIIKRSVDISKLILQKDELSQVAFFSEKDILDRINNNYFELTEKITSWHFLKQIFERDLLKGL